MKYPLLSKAAAIGAVILLLCIVLARINVLVTERQYRQNHAVQSVEESLAGAQVLLGPLLQRSCTEEWDFDIGEGKDRRKSTEKREFLLTSPSHKLQIDSEAKSDLRYRGLFRVNSYGGATTLQARWDQLAAMEPKREHAGSRLQCGSMVVMLAVSDVRGLRSVTAQADSETVPVRAGTRHAQYVKGVHLELPAKRAARPADALAVTFKLDLAGTARLSVVPAAESVAWSLKSDWPHPSFGGRFLPAERTVTDAGFSARWAVSSLASTAAAEVQRAGQMCDVFVGEPQDTDDGYGGRPAHDPKCLETLSVAFIDPVNPYVLTDRATKYALLFIVLTFAGVALVEVLARRRVHPVQYALVGFSLAIFYLLLLSLSEHVGFGPAYAVATVACVALLGFYAAHMLGSAKAACTFGVGIAALYGLLWVLLRLEQTALLVGSVLLFSLLSAAMVATRKVDWYDVVYQWRVPASKSTL
ncbi:MAG: cell envelope integrity protein CreD [Pseudomonadota bacterium]